MEAAFDAGPPRKVRPPQLAGYFRMWPIGEVATRLIEVRSVGRSGLHLLTFSSSHFDPNRSCCRGMFAKPTNTRVSAASPAHC